MEDKEKKKRRADDMLNAGVAGAAYETVQRFGSAAKEHYVAYSGVDNERIDPKTGDAFQLKKSLKSISQEKIHPDYKYQNIHQQAGFSAEVKDVARTNAEKIISGDPTRKVRTDDLGSVNDQIFDHVEVDAGGNVIEGTGAQMKFIGASESDPKGELVPGKVLDRLQSNKFEKYLDNDAKIEVPSDQYDSILSEADKRIEKLSEQLENQKAKGNAGQAEKIQAKIDKLETIKKNLRKSSVSSDEAVFARLHPELSTAVDVAKLAHRAGIQTAETAAIIGGSVSIVRNLVAVCRGDEDPQEALGNVAKDTLSTTAVGYGTGFAGMTIKGAMQNSKSEYARALSKTNVAGTLVAVAVSASKTLVRYFNGEIDGVECLETLGEQGTGMVASAMFSAIGQIAIPIPVVGGLIGGMVGYAISSASYGVLASSLKDAKLAREERIAIEKSCEEHIKMIREYRAEIEKIINEYLSESMSIFRDSFSGIKDALVIGDVDLFIESANTITESFGGKASFSDMDEFNRMMMSGTTFTL